MCSHASLRLATHILRIVLLPLEPLQPVSLKHDLGSPRSDNQPVDNIRSQRAEDEQPLMSFFARRPVGRDTRRRDEVGVEPQMREE